MDRSIPQLLAVARAIALDRYRDGYNSATIVQIIGPQVVAKPRMKKQAKTIMALPAWGVFWGTLRSRAKWPTGEPLAFSDSVGDEIMFT